MAFNKSAYAATVKAALDKAVTDNGGVAPAENQDIADALGDAVETAFSQLEVAAGKVSVPALGLIAPNGPVTGSATTALIAPGDIG